jgi:succinate dehydrogenase / fumarate reductase iron-sulfur subunit
MVQFTLPKNSRVGTGKTWPRPEASGEVTEFRLRTA